MHVRDIGDGPVLVLLHAFPCDGRMWEPQAEAAVAAGWRVLVPDLPGFGRVAPARGGAGAVRRGGCGDRHARRPRDRSVRPRWGVAGRLRGHGAAPGKAVDGGRRWSCATRRRLLTARTLGRTASGWPGWRSRPGTASAASSSRRCCRGCWATRPARGGPRSSSGSAAGSTGPTPRPSPGTSGRWPSDRTRSWISPTSIRPTLVVWGDEDALSDRAEQDRMTGAVSDASLVVVPRCRPSVERGGPGGGLGRVGAVPRRRSRPPSRLRATSSVEPLHGANQQSKAVPAQLATNCDGKRFNSVRGRRLT